MTERLDLSQDDIYLFALRLASVGLQHWAKMDPQNLGKRETRGFALLREMLSHSYNRHALQAMLDHPVMARAAIIRLEDDLQTIRNRRILREKIHVRNGTQRAADRPEEAH